MTKFSADFFSGNRRTLKRLLPDTLIVLTANGQLQKGGDAPFPFQQDASFWYLTGIDDPDVILVIDNDHEFLIVPNLSDYQDVFDGGINQHELEDQSGVKYILDHEAGWEKLQASLKKAKTVMTAQANDAYVELFGMYTNPAKAHLLVKLREVHRDLKIEDIRPTIARLRMVKQPEELHAMKKAVSLTCEILEKLKKELPKLHHEYEIEALISEYFLSHGADNAWKPIVASGKNSCILHARSNRAVLHKEDVVVLDIGAEVNHYCSDITRTYSIGNKPSKRQQEVYEAVKAVQDFTFSLQKPGAHIRDNEKTIEKFMGEQLKKLGLIKTLDKKAIRKYYPHAASHFLGIDPHDAGDYEAALVPGVVLTVEPGIYIPEEGIGFRIEDDVLITEAGHDVLSANLAKSL